MFFQTKINHHISLFSSSPLNLSTYFNLGIHYNFLLGSAPPRNELRGIRRLEVGRIWRARKEVGWVPDGDVNVIHRLRAFAAVRRACQTRLRMRRISHVEISKQSSPGINHHKNDVCRRYEAVDYYDSQNSYRSEYRSLHLHLE